jgi:hypothetical protein
LYIIPKFNASLAIAGTTITIGDTMRLHILVISIALAATTACNNKQQPEETVTPSTDTPVNDSHISTTPIPLDGCYRMVINKDTARLRLNVVDSMVTGELKYHWYEKDRNEGSVKGVIRDSLLILNYTFRSEGTTSVRQVVFKLAGTSLLEGQGEMITSDTVRYKDINQLQFQHNTPFIKINCAEQ